MDILKACKNKINPFFVILKYVNDKPVIQKLEQISTSSQKVYSSYAQLNVPNQGLGLVLLSTSKGILSSSKALELKVGGEVLCKIFLNLLKEVFFYELSTYYKTIYFLFLPQFR
jgi:small subunit ribosomal protein S8